MTTQMYPAQNATLLIEAQKLCKETPVIDMHVDSYIWSRIGGYEINKKHGPGLLGARFFRQVDMPRLKEAGVDAATWVITTNPFRSTRGRAKALRRNMRRIEMMLEKNPMVGVVANYRQYLEQRERGSHAAFIGLQGGNAFGGDFDLLTELAPKLLRVTLMHLTASKLGSASTPIVGGFGGLKKRGIAFVEAANANRVFVDLSHISRKGFFDALEHHSKDIAPIVTHTGVDHIRPCWRNITDMQIRAIADRDGIVGIIFEVHFLRKRGAASVDNIVDHIEHVIDVVGDDYVGLGSDWDGCIRTPRDMPSCLELPVLVSAMLQRQWSDTRIQKILGGNFLRVLQQYRP